MRFVWNDPPCGNLLLNRFTYTGAVAASAAAAAAAAATWAQKGPKMGPEWARMAPRWAQNGPKIGPRWAPEYAKY
jgi:Spy/CpxP family protein refolding chaperone